MRTRAGSVHSWVNVSSNTAGKLDKVITYSILLSLNCFISEKRQKSFTALFGTNYRRIKCLGSTWEITDLLSHALVLCFVENTGQSVIKPAQYFLQQQQNAWTSLNTKDCFSTTTEISGAPLKCSTGSVWVQPKCDQHRANWELEWFMKETLSGFGWAFGWFWLKHTSALTSRDVWKNCKPTGSQ